MTEPTIAELKEQIKQYEMQLEKEKLANVTQREKISTMSSEVVDSNPYRLLKLIHLGIFISVFGINNKFNIIFILKSFDGFEENGHCGKL